ncbi:hypothetical protein AB4Y43_16730 [Paraburkholderia sp. BR10872]|uniref:hypothetical protein n=1 Tax=Paraburkholderia sp. BR10872 TaxID=3236989 RepID=UPI0034D1814A
MAADKLGRFITSPAFLGRANAAVNKAVDNLEAKGVKPAYIVRASKRKGDHAAPAKRKTFKAA